MTLERDRQTVLDHLQSYSVKIALPGEEFTLSSGRKSRFYIDAKRTILHREMHEPLVHLLCAEVGHFGAVDAVAGCVLGGCHLASIVAASSAIAGRHLFNVIFVRGAAKDHGTGHVVEAAWTPRLRERVVLLEDVLSTGQTIHNAIVELDAAGYDVAGVVALIDRRQVFAPLAGIRRFQAVFTLDDFARRELA